MADILIYKCDAIIPPPDIDETLKLKVWRPTISSMIPKRKDSKYLLYSIFHFFRVFNNKEYAQVQLVHQDEVVSGMLVVPGYFRWPFMPENDVQFTYVITDPEFRRRGYAWQMIYRMYEVLRKKDGINYWYVTDAQNLASIHLAEKMGFTLVGRGVKENVFGLNLLKRLKIKNKAGN